MKASPSPFPPTLSYAYGVMFRVFPTPHSPYRYVGIASFCYEPRVSDTVVVGGFLVTVESFDTEGFMYVTSAQNTRE